MPVDRPLSAGDSGGRLPVVPEHRPTQEDPVTTGEDREFLPAMTRPALLRFYDPISRLLGARDVQWQLVAQAGIEPGATVVEIGCGTGNVLLLAARVVPDAIVIGLDPDADALARADRKLRRAGLAARLDRGYADRLPYDDASVHRVLSAFMLHHLPPDQQQAALHEVHRVLAPGGRVHLVDFDGGRPTPPRALRLLHRGHVRTHAHVHAASPDDPEAVPAALHDAGFAEVARIGHGTTAFGRHTFHRATR
jgi:ubiquinone/menaquinone biosynthesis C-methylase UbiE